MAISLVTPTGGGPDLERGNAILRDVMKDETAEGRLRGMAAAALADSARPGRGMRVDASGARFTSRPLNWGIKPRHTISVFSVWAEEDVNIARDRTKAMQSDRRGAEDKRCKRRLKRCVEAVPPASRAGGKSWEAPDGFLPSIDKGKVTEKRLPVLRDASAYCPTRKSLQCDKLAFKQRSKFFPIGNVIGGVLDQHQCCKFVGAQHGMLLMQRGKRSSSYVPVTGVR